MIVEILIIIGMLTVFGFIMWICERIRPGSTDKYWEKYKENEEIRNRQRIHISSWELANEINKIENAKKTNDARRGNK